jgi:protein TonB
MTASIGTEGHVYRLEVISGHPLLVPAAMEAVNQWVYAPLTSAGSFEIDVPFALSPQDR